MKQYILVVESSYRYAGSSFRRYDIKGKSAQDAFTRFMEVKLRKGSEYAPQKYTWADAEDLDGRKVYATDECFDFDKPMHKGKYQKKKIFKVLTSAKEAAADEKELQRELRAYKLKGKGKTFHYNEEETSYLVLAP